MHCLACDVVLSDREASRKYGNCKDISNPEDQYIGLCNNCIKDTDLTYTENVNASEEKAGYEEDAEEVFFFGDED